MIKIKRLLAGAAVAALPLGFALASPAQAVTGTECGDGADWDWKITNPARYIGTGDHEAVVGLSDATRKVTILAPAGCTFDIGDRWRVYNGYFSAEGTISQAEVDAPGDLISDSDTVLVEKPSSNAVAGDDIGVHLKVNDEGAATDGWEVDKYSSVAPLNLLRRTEFTYKTTPNRINFGPEPYIDEVKASGKLIRASWTSNAYVGYEGRNVHIQTREDITDAKYEDVGEVTTGTGGVVSFTFKVSETGGPDPTEAFIGRGLYNGNGTSSGTYSVGDRVLAAA